MYVSNFAFSLSEVMFQTFKKREKEFFSILNFLKKNRFNQLSNIYYLGYNFLMILFEVTNNNPGPCIDYKKLNKIV